MPIVMMPDVIPQQLIMSNVLLATRYGCNSLLLKSQGSISATLAIVVGQC